MSASDVSRLIADEKLGETVIGWQAKTLWDQAKNKVSTDADAVWLSHKLRALQHHFLQVLYEIALAGHPHFLLQFIPYRFAFQKIEMTDFDTKTLTATITATPQNNKYTWSKARRIVRIAFEELTTYAEKVLRRKVLPIPSVEPNTGQIINALKSVHAEQNALWKRALKNKNVDLRERAIEALLRREGALLTDYEPARSLMEQHFQKLGEAMAKLPNKLFAGDVAESEDDEDV